ncbi:hypothetical protein KHA94_00325 [Bacillus sp. FJAT-49705]|uniref:Uncharacterized protein n=1 Tax=Cytobacillus citreus TaxID=2833586 RepID=A0ABS5NLH4_9BACI|nr:hypothetical protein [Cytobacillus citreus]MBS4188665.1 hypothetical protein [Cytobacillus citreus]
MKKLLFAFLMLSLFLFSCSSEETTKPESEKLTEEAASKEPTQEELNEKLKSEAVKADFVKLNGDEAEKGLKVHAVGKVSVIAEDGIFRTFTLTTEEGEGFGMYSILDVLKETEYAEGDTVKVYGSYDGKDDLGFPQINSTVIEKQ